MIRRATVLVGLLSSAPALTETLREAIAEACAVATVASDAAPVRATSDRTFRGF